MTTIASSPPRSLLRPAGFAGARFWWSVAGIWTALALLGAAQTGAQLALQDLPIRWGSIIIGSFADWYTCALFSPAFLWMASRYPLRGEGWPARLPAHVAAAVAFVFAKSILHAMVLRALGNAGEGLFAAVLVGGFVADILTYGAIAGLLHAMIYYREAVNRRLTAATLEAELRSAQLENLRAQMQPHFLFNTLQAISTLIHRDPGAADRMLTDLSELLRLSAGPVAEQLVPLRRELGFLSRYVDLMRRRYPDRLEVAVDVAEPVLDIEVPSLLLQPLVENAIEHGMADRAAPCRVVVTARQEGPSIRIAVSDDGVGPPAELREGVGLGNLRKRLSTLYDGGAELRGEAADPSGMLVVVSLPIAGLVES